MRLIALSILLLTCSESADAQFNCPAGSWPESPGGNVTVCRCVDGSLANYDGCRNSPLNNPPAVEQSYQAPSTGFESSPIWKALEFLDSLIMYSEKNVTTWGTLSNQLPATPPPPPNHAAQVALQEMLRQSTTNTSPSSSQATSPLKLPDYPTQTPTPAPSSPKSTCSDYRDPNCFVTLKPPSGSE